MSHRRIYKAWSRPRTGVEGVEAEKLTTLYLLEKQGKKC
jgi:hypothetical protein